HNECFRMIKWRFQHSTQTIHECFHEVLRGMMQFAREVIVPTTLEANTSERHRNLREIFMGAIGALDGTLVHAVVHVDQQIRYRGRGKEVAFNPNSNFPFPPPNKYYLCDAAYTNTRGFMAPYRNTRYWLADFRRRRALTKEERFNHAHAQLRNVIERAYGVLKARFPILKQMAPYPFPVQRNVVIACFAVHNFIGKCNIHDQLFLESDANTMFTTEQQGEGGGGQGMDDAQWGPQGNEYMANLHRGGEYVSQEFKDYLKACEIVQQLTPPYTLQHNEDYALETVIRILNMVPTKKALMKQDTLDKLQQRSIKCIFIGYPKETMGYYFYFPPENKIVVARYVEFLEKNLLSQEVSGRAEELEEIQDKDTSPSENTSKIPMEVEGFEPPQEEVVPIRRSARTHQASDRLCLNVELEEHSLGDLNEPNNYKAVILDLEFDKWVDDMNSEMQSMKDNQVWCLVDLSPNCKTVRRKWFFKKKTDMDGIVHTYKALLVEIDYTQTYRVDYEEMFSPVADIRAIRNLIAIAAFYDYEI
ncbi:retrovirus-related pol polyprotein from transposon TNT 1-94, partial [Tanacetum coccineum]